MWYCFNDNTRVLILPSVLAYDSLVWILEPVASAMQSIWSVLIAIFHISKELQSSWREHFCSALMYSWSCLHMPWWLSLILFIWPSIQRLPLLSLQETHILFWYLLWAIYMDTSSMSEHVMQSLEAVSISVFHVFSWQVGVWWGLIPSAPWAFSSCSIIRVSNGPRWAKGDWQVPALTVQSWDQPLVLVLACFHHPVWSCDHSQFWPLGSWCESSCCDCGQVNCWESSPVFSVWRWLRTQQMGALQGECP